MPTYEEEQDALLEQALQQHQQQVEAAATVQSPQQQAPVAQPEPQQQPSQAASQQPSVMTPQEVARTTEAQRRPEGLATMIGNWWNSLNPSDITDQKVAEVNAFVQGLPDNALTAPLKSAVAEVDRLTLSKAEKDELLFALIDKGVETAKANNPGGDPETFESMGTFAKGQVAIELGQQVGAKNIPTSALAGIMGEDDPWNQAPEVVKQTPGGEQLFTIAREVTPAVMLMAAGSPGALNLAGAKGRLAQAGMNVLEAGVDAAGATNIDSTMSGRRLAGAFGELAEANGLDGNAVARELAEGSTGRANAFIRTVSFIEGLGINFGIDALIKAGGALFGAAGKQLGGNVDDAAEILGKTPDEVIKEIDNVHAPNYRPDFEPSESLDALSAVRTPKPSPGNKYINDSALMSDALRRGGLGADALTEADARFFTNLNSVVSKADAAKVVDEATKTLAKVRKGFRSQKQLIADRAKAFWRENGYLLDTETGLDDAIELVRSHWVDDLTRIREGGEGVAALMGKDPNLIKNWAEVNETGFLVTPLILEKLGVHAAKIARQATNLDAIGVDFMNHVEQFVSLHSRIQEFAVPLARAKSTWNIGGVAQQRGFRGLVLGQTDDSISLAGRHLDAGSDFKSFTTIYKDDYDVGATLNDLLYRYKNGDVDAGDTLKQYMRLVAYGNPRTTSTLITNLGAALSDQLAKGNSRAISNMYFAGMLTNIGTHVVSAVSGVIRIITDPLGAMLSGNRAYGLGQIAGMVSAKDEVFGVIRRSWLENRALTGGSKFDVDAADLKKLVLEEEAAYEGLTKQMAEEGADTLHQISAFFAHNYRLFSLHPLTGAAGRALTAVDDGIKVIYASGIAGGLAMQEAVTAGIKRGTPEFDALMKGYMDEVFSKGIKNGEIAKEYQPYLKNVTMQSDIPIDGNFVDAGFRGVEQFAKDSAIGRVISPFTRVSYNSLEQTARLDPTGILRSTVPRYNAILNGTDEVAKIQLKSQIAFGKTLTATTAMLAAMGLVTGYNSGDMPQTSFIIPKPGGGFFHFDYSKFPPYSIIVALTTDAANGLRDEVISEGQYGRFIGNMVYSLGMASFDQTFLTNMLRFSQVLDVKNMSEGRAISASRFFASIGHNIGLGPVAGITRTAGRVLQPNQTITRGANIFESFWNAMKSQVTGGASQPVMHDQFTGEPIARTNMAGNQDNWLLQAGAGLLGQVIPGNSGSTSANKELYDELNFLNYEADEDASIRMWKGVNLTADEQSILSRDIALVGNLAGELEAYFKSDRYKRLKQQYNGFRLRENPAAMTGMGTAPRAEEILADIHKDINRVRREAKDRAVRQGELGSNGTGLMTRVTVKNAPLGDIPQQGLNPLQRALQPILDLPK